MRECAEVGVYVAWLLSSLLFIGPNTTTSEQKDASVSVLNGRLAEANNHREVLQQQVLDLSSQVRVLCFPLGSGRSAVVS